MRSVVGALLCVACGAPPSTTPSAAVVQAPRSVTPIAEAPMARDLAWLVDPARAGRGSRSPEAVATAAWLATELRAVGYDVQRQRIPSVPGQHNVIATRGGRGRAVLVMAHYDHVGVLAGAIHPGADDNASGVVVALAVARDLASRADAPHTIFVFTGAEEIGLDGAHAFTAAPTVPLAQIRAVYNLDMVGRNFFAEGPNQPDTIAAVGLTDDAALAERGVELARRAGLTLLPVAPGWVSLVRQDFRSDDWVFRARGVFAVHFSTGVNADYHEPTDTFDKISVPQLVKVATMLRDLVVATPR